MKKLLRFLPLLILAVAVVGTGLIAADSQQTKAQGSEILDARTATSKTYYLGQTVDGRDRYALDCSIGAIHYLNESGNWQDIDVTAEEPDTDGFSVKFTKLYYFGKIGDDSKRRLYPDRNDLSYWIEFKKPYTQMGIPTRQDRWFYWNFANALMGVRFDSTSVKFGFRLKNANAPTSITIPFETQGLTRPEGRFLLHNGQVVAEMRKPVAYGSNLDEWGDPISKLCQVSFGPGEVTVSLDPSGLEYPIDIDPTLDLQVGAGADDASERESDGTMYTTGTVWCRSSTNVTERLWPGFRWASGSLPSQGDTIDVCYAEPYVHSYTNDDANLKWYFQKAAAPASFSSDASDISNRTRTSAGVDWIQDALIPGFHETPSLVTPFQEVVNSYSPTAVVLIGVPYQDVDKKLQMRNYEDYSTQAAKFHVEYTAGAPPYIPRPSGIAGNPMIMCPLPLMLPIIAWLRRN